MYVFKECIMVSSISGSAGYISTMASAMGRSQRPDTSRIAEDLFSKLDSSSKGYLEVSDLETAFGEMSSSTVASASEVFSSLDGDSDGKVTQDEMAQALSELESQFQSLRMKGGGPMEGMMPPPPPPEEDEGFTQEELSSQLEEIGETDSARSALISSIVSNFDAADTDGDGKVSLKEAMAYQESAQASTGSSSNEGSAISDAGDSTGEGGTTARVLLQIMRLSEAYGLGRQSEVGGGLSQLA